MKEMNKKERFDAVLAGKAPDRIPFSFWFHFSGSQEEGDACIQAHLNFYRATNLDYLKIMSDGLLYPIYETIHCASDWAKLKPLPKDNLFFVETVRRCKEINTAIGSECYTFFNFFAPFSFLRNVTTMTDEALQGRTVDATVMAHLKEDETAVLHALHVIATDMAYLAERVIKEGGCLGIYQSVQGAEKGRMSAEEYKKWIEPSDKIVIDAFNKLSRCNILHMCSWAGNPNHLSYWKHYSAAVKNWGVGIEGLSLKGGLAYFPGSVMLGGIDNRKDHALYAGTKQEVQDNVRAVCMQMGATPFILGADCTVPADIDLARFDWVREALEQL